MHGVLTDSPTVGRLSLLDDDQLAQQSQNFLFLSQSAMSDHLTIEWVRISLWLHRVPYAHYLALDFPDDLPLNPYLTLIGDHGEPLGFHGESEFRALFAATLQAFGQTLEDGAALGYLDLRTAKPISAEAYLQQVGRQPAISL
jgi:hypothetical protein